MLNWIRSKFGGGEERAITYSTGLGAGLIAGPTYSGMPVTAETAIGLSSLWCGIRVISEALGSLPPVLYTKSPAGRKPAENHPLYPLLHSEPNIEQTRPVFWETLLSHAILFGNGFAEIERSEDGRPLAMWNIHPRYVRVMRDSETGLLVYQVQTSIRGGPPGQPGATKEIAAADMFHIPGLGPDGSVGYEIIRIARETIGFGLASQRYGNSLFRNMGRPSGVIDIPQSQKLNDQGRANLKKGFREETGGENVGSTIVMENGNKFTPLNLATNEQTQYQQLCQFHVYEIARTLNITPVKLHSLERATWANLETLNADFLTTTMRPWIEKCECEGEKKLLMPSEKGKFFIEFDTSQLLRVDQKTRYACYAQASGNSPWMTVNEIRLAENKLPIDGGDELPGAAPPPEPPADNPPDETKAEAPPTEGSKDDS